MFVVFMFFGMGNVLVCNFGIVDESFFVDFLVYVFDFIVSGVFLWIDMGLMNGEYFVGMVGVGFLFDVFMVFESGVKMMFKNLVYVKVMLEMMVMSLVIFKIMVVGSIFKVSVFGIFVVNVEDLGLGKFCDLYIFIDGYFNLYVLDLCNFSDYVVVGFCFVVGYVEGKVFYYVFSVKEVLIEVLLICSLCLYF